MSETVATGGAAERIRITILGCGASPGVPRVGNDWGACDPSEPRNRRTRSSILIDGFSSRGPYPTRVLVDTGPDLRAQLLDAFDFVADAGKIARSKPAPDIFLACAEALGIAPEACVGFEDAAAGIAAIKAAGMTAIGIGDPLVLGAADRVFATTAAVELASVLRLAR